ncbi:DUF3263 domain-containing protein [Glaciibacter sp. 2TAF33]|uniref:DUF3263 domain-containing protein n=1 Tax=Glaciibacter sp. 2TAF33 TaxID=3233015 RepID=UPI003F917A99
MQSEPEPGTDPERVDLSERDRAILAFERRDWQKAGEKEEAIRTEFGLSAARYYQLLGALIDSPYALVADPMLVKRLQRMRHVRRDTRQARSLASLALQSARPATHIEPPRSQPRTESD